MAPIVHNPGRSMRRWPTAALAFRTNAVKTPAGRARKIAALLGMLERGETIIAGRR